MRYPILLFDADNTLFDFPAAERAAFQEVCREAGFSFSEEGYALYHRCNGELWEDFNAGRCTKEFLLVERFRRYLARSGQAGDPEQMNRTHLRMLATSAVLFPDALPVCRILAEKRRLYIITDMEFDCCTEDASLTNFEAAKRRFGEAGYRLPEVVFWNIDSRQRQQPVSANEQGVTLLSGLSPRLFSFLTERDLTPERFMRKILLSDRYAPIVA